MNTLIFLTLVAAAAAATVVSNNVPEVPEVAKVPDVAEVAEVAKVPDVAEVVKASEVAKMPAEAEVAPMTDLAEDLEVQYDEFGVPMRTLPAFLQSLTVGVVGPDDRLISRITHNVAAAAFIIHDQDVRINGAHGTNITSVQVTRVGNTMHAIPTIKSGGLGQSFVVVNILGVRGSAFSYTISVYASIGCANS